MKDDARRSRTHPGAILREDVLPALGLSIGEAARQLGVTRQTLHRIMAEKVSVTPEMAARLGRFCGNGSGIWLRMQQACDLWRAGGSRNRHGDHVSEKGRQSCCLAVHTEGRICVQTELNYGESVTMDGTNICPSTLPPEYLPN